MKNYYRREWLNTHDQGMACIEVSVDHDHEYGDGTVTIFDCSRKASLEFFVGDDEARRNSLAKITIMLAVLTEFRDELSKLAKRRAAHPTS